ncbi:MAG TPA: flagellar biosynthetic protein FliO [Steroidobacteraceae bacterium]|jgi:flagellar protein FliO/FliZ
MLTAALLGAFALSGALCAAAAEAPAVSAHPFAAPQPASPVSPAGLGGLGQVTFALLLVLASIFLIAWLARRMRSFGNRMGTALDVLADIPLGQKERAVLIKVGQTQILVGVAPGHVNTLHVLAEPIELVKPAAGLADNRPSFKALMLRSLGK